MWDSFLESKMKGTSVDMHNVVHAGKETDTNDNKMWVVLQFYNSFLNLDNFFYGTACFKRVVFQCYVVAMTTSKKPCKMQHAF